MSVSRSGNSSSGVSYADHDVHHIRHRVQYDNDADSGPSTSLQDEQQFEITARGIDPDELAELRFMRVTCLIKSTVSPLPQDEIGSCFASFESGFNLSGTEYLLDGIDGETEVDVDSSGTTDFFTATKSTDEVGQLTHDQLSMYVGYSDTNDGTGGSASAPHRAYVLNMADVFGSGPYVDAADDFTSRVALDVNNLVAGVSAEVNYSLYYNVDEIEGGRTRFGR